MADLTPQQKEFYASMEATFMTPGWDLLVKGWREEQDRLPLDTFFNANSIEDVRASRVRYGLLNELVTLADTIAQQKLNVVENVGDNE